MKDIDPVEPTPTKTFDEVVAMRSLRSASLPFRATAGGAKGFDVDLREDLAPGLVAATILRAMSRVCSWSGNQARSATIAFGRPLRPGAARLYVIEHAAGDGVTHASATLEQDERVAVSALGTFSAGEAEPAVVDDTSWEDAEPAVRGGWTELPGRRVDEASVIAAMTGVRAPTVDALHGHRADDPLALTVVFAPLPELEDARGALVRWRVHSVAGGVYQEDGELYGSGGRLLARSSLTGRCHAEQAGESRAAA